MPSSGAYAAPIELDLRPGRLERGTLLLGAALAVAGIAALFVDAWIQAGCAAVVVAVSIRAWQQLERRPAALLLHADGAVECGARGALHPASLEQASVFGGLTQLQWRDADDRWHAVLILPDRLNAEGRHRLRLWLATHRPESEASDAPNASASCQRRAVQAAGSKSGAAAAARSAGP
jgi:hypothetical protein